MIPCSPGERGLIMNAYFRLIISQTGTAIELIPQTVGGSPLSMDEIAAYLQLKGIVDYDIKLIYQTIGRLKDKPVQIPLCFLHYLAQ